MKSASLLLAAGLGLAALLVTGSASAYCRTTSCGDAGTGARCTPAQSTDCGTPLFWSTPCMSWSLQKDASKQVDFATAEKVFTQAFATWENAACPGGGTPRIAPTDLGPVECTLHEYNKDKANANIIVFRDDGWPYSGAGATLALTTVTYNLDTGEIYDADMEINSSQIGLTTGDSNVGYDLLSIATHEAGHFLGIAHSADPDATMFTNYVMGDIGLRDLTDDDRAAICAAYPSGAPVASSCDPTPRHGFSTLCGDQQPLNTGAEEDGGCAVAEAGAGEIGGAAAGLAGLALLAARRRRIDRNRIRGARS